MARVPKLQHHRATGQGRVTIQGRDYWLGDFGTAACEARYRKLVGEFFATGAIPQPKRKRTDKPEGLLVAELIANYVTQHVCGYHIGADGKPTSEQAAIRAALKVVRKTYGGIPVSEFGPLKLKAVREQWIAGGLARSTINANTSRVKRMVRWAVENEQAPPAVYQALAAVKGLAKGRSEAKETLPVRPVDPHVAWKTRRFLTRPLRAMTMLQRLSAARPGELCILRPCDIDMSGEVWTFTPERHKKSYLDRERVIFFGPKCQRILRPFLADRDPDAYVFSPIESEAERHAAMRAARKTKVQPSQMARGTRKPKRPPGERYTTDSYRRAIQRAAKCAGVPSWGPNQLRHSGATNIRKRFGLEGAQVALGHASADITQVYAERDHELGRKVAAEIG